PVASCTCCRGTAPCTGSRNSGRRCPGVNRGGVVTGASTGIGAAIARHLAGRGFRVFGTVRRAEDEVALARDGVTALRMDVTDTASITRVRGEVERALGTTPLIALVNNAGIPAAGPLELFPLDELRRVLEAGSFKTAIWSKVEAMDLRPYAGTPYESVLARFWRASLRGAERAPPPDKVARAVWRALKARRPPLRVMVTPHGWLDRIPLWIPDRWLDWLIYRLLWRGVRLPPS